MFTPHFCGKLCHASVKPNGASQVLGWLTSLDLEWPSHGGPDEINLRWISLADVITVEFVYLHITSMRTDLVYY